MGSKVCHRYHLVDESPWLFLVSTASLFLTLGAVLFFHFFYYSFFYDSDFCCMMFSVIFKNPFGSKTKFVLCNTTFFTRKNYSNQIVIDNLFRTQNVLGLNDLVENSLRHNLIDPIKNENVSVHQIDIMSQVSIKKFNITYHDLVKNFNFASFFNTRHNNLYLAKAQFQHIQNLKLQAYHQRSNTIAETTVLQASKSNFPYLRSIEMTWNNKINTPSIKLTGNINPDYACSIVWQNGNYYYYHADLKNTTLVSFEKKVLHLHPNAIINTNFYWINDPNFCENYVFSGVTKFRLETTYFGVIQYYAKLDPKLASEMYKQSSFAFNNFQKSGLVKDYNNIPINTPKFITWKWIDSLF